MLRPLSRISAVASLTAAGQLCRQLRHLEAAFVVAALVRHCPATPMQVTPRGY